MSSADAALAALRSQLTATAGGYLRNLVTVGTCGRCFTPTDGDQLCARCRHDDLVDGLPDVRGFMTYASHVEPIQQSGRVMRSYKSPIRPSRSAARTVSLLAALALRGHRRCPGALVGTRPTAWSVVPSLPHKPAHEHALSAIVRSLARPSSVELVLRGADEVESPRALRADHFDVLTAVPPRAHVLLVDDTWTSGGHAQSAAMALRAAGATHVSLLALARWLTPDWGATTTSWMRRTLTAVDYDATVCPWTRGECPGPPV